MKTDDLIATLADGMSPVGTRHLSRSVFVGLACGVALTALLFAVFWGIRPDPSLLLRDGSLFAKTALPFVLALLAWRWLLAQARPGAQSRAATLVTAVPIVAALLVVVALLRTPTEGWSMAVQGKSVVTCLTSVPLLAAPILTGLLVALRIGAPEHPTRCGAVAGLFAGAVAAAIYSLYCVEDSPLFYSLWYSLAIMAVCACGAVVGRTQLRW